MRGNFFFHKAHAPCGELFSEEAIRQTLRAFATPPWNRTYRPEVVRNIFRALQKTKGFFGLYAQARDRNLVGMVIAGAETCDKGKGFMQLHHLCVDPDFHGKGLGRSLAENVIGEARARGLGGVQLHTLDDGPAANLYKRLGFVGRPCPEQAGWQEMTLTF